MTFLAILGIVFLILPLPLCIYLIVKRSKDLARIQELESDVAQLKGDPTEPAVATSAPAVPPAPEPSPTPSPFSQGEPETPEYKPSSEPATPKLIFTDDVDDAPTKKPEVASIPRTQTDSEPSRPSLFSRLAAHLRSIGIWPPEEFASAEAGLMQWWLPRIGGLLATLAVISFAVYISQGTPSWVRFVELVLADAAVLGIGIFFLKKRPSYGSTLISTGLSMFYFTSIAAYAASPVRVIHNPLIGVIIQLAIVAVIFLVSLRLRNRNIAIMALVYGFISSLFSSYAGLMESALISALALYIIGIFFSRRFDWYPILSIATIGAYLPVASFNLLDLFSSTNIILPDAWSVIAYLLISVSLLPVADLRWNLSQSFSSLNRLHAINTSLCLFIGYWYTQSFASELLIFYGRATIVFAAWAAIFARRDLRSFLFQLFFLKATALAALWLVNRYEGDERWFALIIEAALVCWIAVRSKSLWQELACLALWLVSVVVAADGIERIELSIGEARWWLYMLHPIIAAGILAYLHQARKADGRETRFYYIAAVINGIIATTFLSLTDTANDATPFVVAAYSVAMCAIGLIPRLSASSAATSSAFPLVAANLLFWIYPDNEASGALVALTTIGFAFAIARAHSERQIRFFPHLEFLFHCGWITTVFAYVSNLFHSEGVYSFLPAVFAMALLAIPQGRFRALHDASLFPIFLFVLYNTDYSANAIGTALAVAAYLGVLVLPTLRPSLAYGFHLFRRGGLWRIFHHCLVALICIRFAFELESWFPRVSILLLLAISFHLLWKTHRRIVALILSAISLVLCFGSLLAIWNASVESYFDILPWAKEALAGGLLLTATAIGLGVDYSKSAKQGLSSGFRTALVYGAATLAYATIAITLSTDLLWNKSSYTPLMALCCLVLIGIGIGAKIKPFRMVALIGFALPLTRLFVYDIRDTLIRIVAFAILAALITFIGYLYHRFQSRID